MLLFGNGSPRPVSTIARQFRAGHTRLVVEPRDVLLILAPDAHRLPRVGVGAARDQPPAGLHPSPSPPNYRYKRLGAVTQQSRGAGWQTCATVARRTAVEANQPQKRIRHKRFGANRRKGGYQMSLDAEKHERLSELFS